MVKALDIPTMLWGPSYRKPASGNTTVYTPNTVYRNNRLELIHMPEGYIEPTDAGYQYIYRLTDHLGNTRVSFKENSVTETLTLLATNDYYPFGLEHGKENIEASSSNLGENYKYNGKELQTEEDLDWYDYGVRKHMPELGRWASIDALAEKYETASPFAYVLNNPINAVDPDGQLVIYVNGLLFDDARSYKLNPINAIAGALR